MLVCMLAGEAPWSCFSLHQGLESWGEEGVGMHRDWTEAFPGRSWQ